MLGWSASQAVLLVVWSSRAVQTQVGELPASTHSTGHHRNVYLLAAFDSDLGEDSDTAATDTGVSINVE